MQNFRVSKIHLGLLFILNILVVILLVRAVERGVSVEIALLSTSVLVGIIYFITLFRREIIIDKNTITIKSGFSTKSISLNNIDYIQTLSAFGRYVILISDGNSSATFSSLISKFDTLIDILKSDIDIKMAKRLEMIKREDIKRKAILFTIVMVGLNFVALYAILMK